MRYLVVGSAAVAERPERTAQDRRGSRRHGCDGQHEARSAPVHSSPVPPPAAASGAAEGLEHALVRLGRDGVALEARPVLEGPR